MTPYEGATKSSTLAVSQVSCHISASIEVMPGWCLILDDAVAGSATHLIACVVCRVPSLPVAPHALSIITYCVCIRGSHYVYNVEGCCQSGVDRLA